MLQRDVGEQPDRPLARRTRTVKLCSSDARSGGQSGYSPTKNANGSEEENSCASVLLCSCIARPPKEDRWLGRWLVPVLAARARLSVARPMPAFEDRPGHPYIK